MLPSVLALNGVVHGDSETARDAVRELLNQAGWILDSTDLANGGVVFAFELPVGNLEWFGSIINDSGFQLDDESRQILEQCAVEAEASETPDRANIRGTLEMTFLQPSQGESSV